MASKFRPEEGFIRERQMTALSALRAVNVGIRALTLATGAAMAFDHLGVARSVVLTGSAISYGSLMLALALSVGIGASGAVQRRIEERLATAAAPPRTVARSARP